MATDHAITIASENNAPNPTGIALDPDQDNPTSDNPWTCPYVCTVPEHTDTVVVIWNGGAFSLPDDEANDPNFGTVNITYDPPLV